MFIKTFFVNHVGTVFQRFSQVTLCAKTTAMLFGVWLAACQEGPVAMGGGEEGIGGDGGLSGAAVDTVDSGEDRDPGGGGAGDADSTWSSDSGGQSSGGGSAGAGNAAGGVTGRAGAGGSIGGGAVGGAIILPPAGAPSVCGGAGLPVCLDFESGIPGDWHVSGDAIGIDTTRSYRGKSALRIRVKGQTRNILSGRLPANAGVLWGRYFLYSTGANRQHGSLMGLSSGGGSSYRMGMSAYRFIGVYNPGDIVTECNPLLNPNMCPPTQMELAKVDLDKWACIEWQADGPSGQPLSVYKNGEKILLRPYSLKWPIVKSFVVGEIGLNMYHPIDRPFDMWIDEVAFDTQRIGCNR